MSSSFRLILLVVGFMVTLVSVADSTLPWQPSVAHGPKVLEKVRNNEWLLIDVRTPTEFAQYHIPGAVNIPHDKIDTHISYLKDGKHKPLIIYCRSGRRSKLAIETLKARSFDNVSHLEGDMMGWHDAGLPVEQM